MDASLACPAGLRVSRDLRDEIEQFLFEEARLLDAEAWDKWLELMTPDVHYWMPTMENRRRADKLKAYEPGRGAYFDDNHADLSKRVARFMQPSAWAEDPPTRHVHAISGVEAFDSGAVDEVEVHSVFINYRSRGERDNDMLIGRRVDRLRRVDERWRIAKRKVLITQALLMSKNLNTFF